MRKQYLNLWQLELRRLATHCNFGSKLEEALRDRLVCGLKASMEGARCLSISDLTLQKALEVATSFEVIERKTKEMQGTVPALPDSDILAMSYSKATNVAIVFVVGKMGINLSSVVSRT